MLNTGIKDSGIRKTGIHGFRILDSRFFESLNPALLFFQQKDPDIRQKVGQKFDLVFAAEGSGRGDPDTIFLTELPEIFKREETQVGRVIPFIRQLAGDRHLAFEENL